MSSRASLFLKIFLGLVVLGVVGLGLAIAVFTAALPNIIRPDQYRPQVVSEVYAENGEKIGEYYDLRRKVIPLDQIPKLVINAFIAAEDAQFFSHKGIDLQGIVRAAIKNFKAGRFVQGGSTITQQVARSLLLTPEKKISRKLKEVFLSMRLEQNLSKKDILFLFLNEIYLGHGAYGVEAAAQNYFGKDVKDLTLAEAAILAGLPQAPSRYSPLINPEAAKERQIYVLRQMVDSGYISKREAQEARDEVLHFLGKHDFNLRYSPYFVEHVRRYLMDKYGADKVLKEGLQIYTTLNLDFQKVANYAIEKGVRQLDKRQGFRGAIEHIDLKNVDSFLAQTQNEIYEESKIVRAVVTSVREGQRKAQVRFGNYMGELVLDELRWARKPNPDVYYGDALVQKISEVLSEGDVIWIRLMETPQDVNKTVHVLLEQDPLVQGALLSFDAHTGFVKSMIGGFDYSKSEFNRALQAERQVGSTFKPIIYLTALEKGYTPASVIQDSPIIYKSEEEKLEEKWKPRNYGEKFYGDTLLAQALAFSRNIVSVKLVQDVKVSSVAETAKKLGIVSPLIEDLSMALGSSSITLGEMCLAFSVFANEGNKTSLVFIKKITDRDGNVLEEYVPPTEQQSIITPQLAYVMTHLLKGVTSYGTGKSVADLNWPIAGKTGTTNDYADAWFLGYTTDLLTGVWTGFDERKKLGEFETGSLAAIPIWKTFMTEALKTYPKRDFSVPDKVVFANVDTRTGKLATRKTKSQISLAFVEGTEPQVMKAAEQKKQEEEEQEFYKEELSP